MLNARPIHVWNGNWIHEEDTVNIRTELGLARGIFLLLWIISSSFLAMNPWTCHSNCAVDRAEYVCKIYAGDIWADARGISCKKFFRSDSLQQCIATEVEVEWNLYADFMNTFIIIIYIRFGLTLRCHLPFFVMHFLFGFCAVTFISCNLRFEAKHIYREGSRKVIGIFRHLIVKKAPPVSSFASHSFSARPLNC